MAATQSVPMLRAHLWGATRMTTGERWRSGLRMLAGLLLWCAVLGVAAIVALPWIATPPIFPEGTRAALALIENFYPTLAMGAAAVTLAGLLLRRRRAALLACAVAVFAVTPVLASIHAAPPIAEDAPRLKVVTFN